MKAKDFEICVLIKKRSQIHCISTLMLFSGPFGGPVVQTLFNSSCVTLLMSRPLEPNGVITKYKVSVVTTVLLYLFAF